MKAEPSPSHSHGSHPLFGWFCNADSKSCPGVLVPHVRDKAWNLHWTSTPGSPVKGPWLCFEEHLAGSVRVVGTAKGRNVVLQEDVGVAWGWLGREGDHCGDVCSALGCMSLCPPPQAVERRRGFPSCDRGGN